jgi:hypothetical protein
MHPHLNLFSSNDTNAPCLVNVYGYTAANIGSNGSGMDTLPKEQGTDDPMEDALPCIVVRNNKRETYSCIVTNGDYALLFGATLKEAFYRPNWQGTLAIRARGLPIDLSPVEIEGSIVWRLPAKEYECNGAERSAGLSRTPEGGRAVSAFPATSLARAVSAANSGKTVCTSYKTLAPSASVFSIGRPNIRRSSSGTNSIGSNRERGASGGTPMDKGVATSGGTFKKPRDRSSPLRRGSGSGGPQMSTFMTGARDPLGDPE